MLDELDRPQEALAAYQQVIDDYRDDPARPARAGRQGAVNQGVDARASWAARRRSWPPTSRSSTTTATTPPRPARVGRQGAVQPGGRPRAAGPPAGGAGRLPAAHRRLPRRPRPALREQVASALFNRGVDPRAAGPPAGGAGRLPAAHRRLPRRPQPRPARAGRQRRCSTGVSPSGGWAARRRRWPPTSSSSTTTATTPTPPCASRSPARCYNRGVTLGQLDRPQEALAAYQQLIDDYRDDPNPACASRSPRR